MFGYRYHIFLGQGHVYEVKFVLKNLTIRDVIIVLMQSITFFFLSFRTYTQYTIVVQAFNKLGAGPMSDEVKQYTSEGVPEQPPHDTTCTTLTSQTIRISWVSPPLNTANGVIKGYKVIYGPSEFWFSEYTVL